MRPSLKIALLVDPLTLQSRGGRHAPALAKQLLAAGHTVRGFGAPPGVIARSEKNSEGLGIGGYEPDVIVAYDSLSPTAFQGARVARSSGAALLLVEPGTTRSATPFHERLLQGIGERMWGRYVRATAAGVVALDPVAYQHSLDDGFEEDRIQLLSTGVDLDIWKPGAGGSVLRSFGIRGRVLVYVGPLETSHGLEDLIAAFAATVGQRNDWSLVLVGNGSGARGLRTKAERLGVASRIHWLRHLDKEELPSLLSASTAFVAPALDDSPRVRPVLRALACGLPVLASDTDRYNWAVKDNETGLLVPQGGKAAWEEALTRAASSPKARERWSLGARSWAEENLNWPDIAASFIDRMYKARAKAEEEQEAG